MLDVGVYVGMYSMYVCIGCRHVCSTLLFHVGMQVVRHCMGCRYVCGICLMYVCL